MKTPRFVVDNSVLMAWCFEDEERGYAEAVLKSVRTNEAVAPSIWPLEAGNALLVAERRQRISKAEVVRFLAMVNDLPIVVEQESPNRMFEEIFALARDCRLSTYGASYVDPAMRLGLPLATQDRSLLDAAQECRMPIFNPNVQV